MMWRALSISPCPPRPPRPWQEASSRCLADPPAGIRLGGGRAHPCRRVIENKHSTEIGARLTLSVNAHTFARRRGRRSDVGRVLVLNETPALYLSALRNISTSSTNSALASSTPATRD